MGIQIFEQIIRQFLLSERNSPSLTGLSLRSQFSSDFSSETARLKGLNAAFLIVLGGPGAPGYQQALNVIKHHELSCASPRLSKFYGQGVDLIRGEIETVFRNNVDFATRLMETGAWLQHRERIWERQEAIKRIWEVFFPEGARLYEEKDKHIQALREFRQIKITLPNSQPITRPVDEILFTSNVLLTVPMEVNPSSLYGVPTGMVEGLLALREEPQCYWYDHPIPVGIPVEKNEVVYGLKGLDEAVRFEKERGSVPKSSTLHCLLSVSVTHEGLQDMARALVTEMIRGAGALDHLKVFLWTEKETSILVEDVLSPAAKHYFGLDATDQLCHIIGVNGEYGRHYSFLRAIAALWQVCYAPNLRGTFKIDLDQVFPQPELVRQTGTSAFEHFKTPLWGANGLDSQGNPVKLGMIAGALVNYEDASRSLFTPDVRYPVEGPKAEECIFFSRLPQAISTEAEMMTRYNEDALEAGRCIHRIHVTGGTCGILVDSLRAYRPFTPTFIARAEDQAYLLSVMFKDVGGFLRYVHKDGLIMRHDKEAFAREAISAAEPGKFAGDLARILLFSYYSRALPWSVADIKEQVDPFTGCFISHIPLTVTYLRLALKIAALFQENQAEKANEYSLAAMARLIPLIQTIKENKEPLREEFRFEQQAWDIYYEILDRVEEGLQGGDTFATSFRRKVGRLIDSCEVV